MEHQPPDLLLPRPLALGLGSQDSTSSASWLSGIFSFGGVLSIRRRVFLKVEPSSVMGYNNKGVSEKKIHQLVGEVTLNWASVESSVFGLFALAMGETHQGSTLYNEDGSVRGYRFAAPVSGAALREVVSFKAKLGAVTAAVGLALTKHPAHRYVILKLLNKCSKASTRRNRVAHSTTMQVGDDEWAIAPHFNMYAPISTAGITYLYADDLRRLADSLTELALTIDQFRIHTSEVLRERKTARPLPRHQPLHSIYPNLDRMQL